MLKVRDFDRCINRTFAGLTTDVDDYFYNTRRRAFETFFFAITAPTSHLRFNESYLDVNLYECMYIYENSKIFEPLQRECCHQINTRPEPRVLLAFSNQVEPSWKTEQA